MPARSSGERSEGANTVWISIQDSSSAAIDSAT
jgi:hypothetical protein